MYCIGVLVGASVYLVNIFIEVRYMKKYLFPSCSIQKTFDIVLSSFFCSFPLYTFLPSFSVQNNRTYRIELTGEFMCDACVWPNSRLVYNTVYMCSDRFDHSVPIQWLYVIRYNCSFLVMPQRLAVNQQISMEHGA